MFPYPELRLTPYFRDEVHNVFAAKKKKKKINVFENTLATTVNEFVINALVKL